MSKNTMLICPNCGNENTRRKRSSSAYCYNCSSEFEVERCGAAPMRIFISYGHKERSERVALALMHELERRGHTVWIDKEVLTHGCNWREEIIAGISESNSVVALLSEHSTREDGVCRDELAISVSFSDAKLVTVLLEPEDVVHVPPTVSHIQYYNMSSLVLHENSEDSEEWLAGRVREIADLIESDESRKYSGEISELTKELRPVTDNSKLNSLLKERFYGREWLFERIAAWRDDNTTPRIFMLYGKPGTGKSAFIAQYAHYNEACIAAVSCEWDKPQYNDAFSIIRTLAFKIATRLPEYRCLLLDQLSDTEAYAAAQKSEAALFDYLLSMPLSHAIDGKRIRSVIVVDGLDEAEKDKNNELARLIGTYIDRLPKWVVFLVTSRNESSVNQYFRTAATLTLENETEANNADINGYVHERLDIDGTREKIVEIEKTATALTVSSQGVLLYAKLICDDICAGVLDPNDVGSFPLGISGVFQSYMQRRFSDLNNYRSFVPFIAAMCASPEPIPYDTFIKLAKSESEVKDFCNRFGSYVLHEECMSFFHKSFADWLCGSDLHNYSVSVSDGKKVLGAICFSSFKSNSMSTFEIEFAPLFLDGTNELSELMHSIQYATDCTETASLHSDTLEYEKTIALYLRAKAIAYEVLTQGENRTAYEMICTCNRNLSDIEDCMLNLNKAYELSSKALEIAHTMHERYNDIRSMYHVSRSLISVGDIKRRLGQLSEALVLYEEGLEIAKHLHNMSQTPESLRDVCAILYNTGYIKSRLEQYDEALALFDESLTYSRYLLEIHETPQTLHSVSACLDSIGYIKAKLGQLSEALALYEESLSLSKRLLETDETPQTLHDMSTLLCSVGSIKEELGKLEEALTLYTESLDILRRLLRIRETPDVLNGLSVGLYNVAGIKEKRGKLDEALTLYTESLDILRRLLRICETPDVLRAVSLRLNKIGCIKVKHRKLDEALTLYGESLEIRIHLLEMHETPLALLDVRTSLEFIGDIKVMQGRYKEALQLFEDSLEISRHLLKIHETPDALRNVSVSLANIGDTKVILGQLDEALTLYEESLEIRRRLLEMDETPQLLHDMSMSLCKIGDAKRSLNQSKEALMIYEEALKIARRSLEMCETPNSLRHVCACLDRVGSILENLDLPEDALTLYEEGLRIARYLLKMNDTPDSRRDICVSLDKVGSIKASLGQLETALALCEESILIHIRSLKTNKTPQMLGDYALSVFRLGYIDSTRRKQFYSEAQRIWLALYEATHIEEYKINAEVVTKELNNLS